MQGLSSRAHAFSVEALVGKPCKRMKVSEGHESNSAGDTVSDTSIVTGETTGNSYWIFENVAGILRTRWNSKNTQNNLVTAVFPVQSTFTFIDFSQFNIYVIIFNPSVDHMELLWEK